MLSSHLSTLVCVQLLLISISLLEPAYGPCVTIGHDAATAEMLCAPANASPCLQERKIGSFLEAMGHMTAKAMKRTDESTM